MKLIRSIYRRKPILLLMGQCFYLKLPAQSVRMRTTGFIVEKTQWTSPPGIFCTSTIAMSVQAVRNIGRNARIESAVTALEDIQIPDFLHFLRNRPTVNLPVDISFSSVCEIYWEESAATDP